MNRLRPLPFLALALVLIPAAFAAEVAFDPRVADRWDAETADIVSRIPIQDHGRVKPLSTFAIFELVKISGRMEYHPAKGRPIPAIYWFLDALFYPEIARKYPVILVENPEVMQELGLPDDDKRTRFTLERFQPHAARLLEKARVIVEKDEKERTLLENQLLNLWDSYASYQSLLHALDFARLHQSIAADDPLAGMLTTLGVQPSTPDGGYHLHYSELLEHLPKLLAILQAQQEVHGENAEQLAPIVQLLTNIENVANDTTALTVVPPVSDPDRETWQSPGSLIDQILHARQPPTRELAAVAGFERLYDTAMRGDRPTFSQSAAALAAQLQADAVQHGQTGRLPLEIFFYKFRPFYWSLALFVFAALLVAVGWMAPRNRWLGRAGVLAVAVPTALLIFGIALRCIIRGRPPVTTLYETTLFIPAVAITVALIAEWITRRRIALSVAAALGCGGLFLAHNFELRGPDTMESMIAVLNSNFWLSTHVTTVTIGYSAGLLACAIAHITLFGRAFGLGRDNPDFYRTVTRLTYGVVCFGALFAFVGTVLGGIWANNSWGRFWGWDPKENGALLIILWFLFILHARLGGYIREIGLALAAVFGGMIVAFSWWGVNLLSIGLHSYGFLPGTSRNLTIYWLIELGVLAVGIVAYFRAQSLAAAARAKNPRPAAHKPRLPETQPGA
jgi:ABC-type transport system involved in cytochrome c biogenesis permease subunit